MKTEKRVAIVGNGAIGNLFAYYLRSLHPTLLLRTERTSNSQQTLSISGVDEHTVYLENEIAHISECEHSALDILIIPVKCYQISQVIEQISDWLSPHTTLILIQNGMGGADELAKAFPNNQLYVGTTTDAAFKPSKNSLTVTAIGQLEIGAYHHSTQLNIDQALLNNKYLARILNLHPTLCLSSDIRQTLLKKLSINAAINPLSALLNITNGELLEHETQLLSVLDEIHRVMQSLGFSYSYQELTDTIYDVIRLTAANYCSMHQDVNNKRKTEIDGVLGYLINHAKKHQLYIPMINNMYERIKSIESCYLDNLNN